MELRHDRNTKLIIFRNDRGDTPHLTLSWNNPSKIIDVHLKSRGAGGSEVHREIGIVQERALLQLLGTFKDRLFGDVLVELSRAAKINPGRLGRWGYAVFYMDEDEKSEFIDKIAPLRKHGKRERILDPEALVHWANSPELRNNIYHTSALHYIADAGKDDVIMAGRVRGNHRPKLLPLGLFRTSDGRPVWIAMDRLSKKMLSLSDTLTLSCLQQLLPNDACDIVFNELHLEEVELFAD